MGDLVIRVEGLGKQYCIGRRLDEYYTLRDLMASLARAPFRLFRSAWDGDRSGASGDEVVWALKEVSFEVQRGEVVGIIGRNGAGKSTLLKILSRITEPTEGHAEIRGRVGSILEVGTGFHPELTGRENIYLSGAILGMKRAEIKRKFDEIVAFAEVERFIDTPVKHYSTGMYLRLAFSVAAHLDPEILLVDEVLAVGDAAFQKKCLGKMGDVAQQGRTVLFVSHNMAAIAALTERSVYLHDGRIVEVGDTQRVIEAYLENISDAHADGIALLGDKPRGSGIVNPSAQFEWVHLIDRQGRRTSDFVEGDPITVVAGFAVREATRDFQFGIGVWSVRLAAGLFVTPSPLYKGLLPEGHYSVCIIIDPNYLRAGTYSLILKMFADGKRQDTLSDVLRFRITRAGAYEEEEGLYATWISGPLKFHYQWAKIEKAG